MTFSDDHQHVIWNGSLKRQNLFSRRIQPYVIFFGGGKDNRHRFWGELVLPPHWGQRSRTSRAGVHLQQDQSLIRVRRSMVAKCQQRRRGEDGDESACYRCRRLSTQLDVMFIGSFANVPQVVLLTGRGEEGYPRASQNGLKQGLLEPFSNFTGPQGALSVARRQHQIRFLQMLFCRAPSCLTPHRSDALLCFL